MLFKLAIVMKSFFVSLPSFNNEYNTVNFFRDHSSVSNATRGGLSKSTISQSDSSFLTSLDILFVPSISKDLGYQPEVKIERFSISDFLLKEDNHQLVLKDN